MTSILLGLAAVALGSYGVAHIFGQFFIVVKGILSLSFICGGLIAVLAGLSSLKKK